MRSATSVGCISRSSATSASSGLVSNDAGDLLPRRRREACVGAAVARDVRGRGTAHRPGLVGLETSIARVDEERRRRPACRTRQRPPAVRPDAAGTAGRSIVPLRSRDAGRVDSPTRAALTKIRRRCTAATKPSTRAARPRGRSPRPRRARWRPVRGEQRQAHQPGHEDGRTRHSSVDAIVRRRHSCQRDRPSGAEPIGEATRQAQRRIARRSLARTDVVTSTGDRFGRVLAEPIGEATRQARPVVRRSRTAFGDDGLTFPRDPYR